MKNLLEFPLADSLQDKEETTNSTSSKEQAKHKDSSKKTERKKSSNKKNHCHTKCGSHKTEKKYCDFPKLTPNIDLMLPVILGFLKEHTGNSSYFIELAQKEALKKSSKDSSAENLLFHLRMCRKSNAKIEEMLHGLCEYISFRFHSSKHTDVNLRFILDKLEKELRVSCKKNIYSIHLQNNIPAFKSDPECLFTVFEYLIKNSMERGEKFYKKLVIQIKVKKLEDRIMFYLHDNGDAISPKEQEHFFSLFEGKNSMNSVEMKTAIACKYIQALGGNMWIESSNKSKTVISFYLPCKSQ